MTDAAYESMDEALETLSAYGPDLSNGLTNHAPMAAEALCALGRPRAVIPWVEKYRPGMLPRPAPVERIRADDWRSCLARAHRFADWSEFFRAELRAAPWAEVVNRWVARLAPGICAAAAHGVIRVGHAVRSLARAPASGLRLGELADALASWAYAYQELPTAEPRPGQARLAPRQAIQRVAVVPPARRRFGGTIVSALAALDEFPEFAGAIHLVDVGGDPTATLLDMAEVFAGVYLANANDILTSIVFIHGVTGVAALHTLLPYMDDATARSALRYAWQASCGLYAAFGSRPQPDAEIDGCDDALEVAVDRAVEHGDEHVIKFTEACLRFDARRPSPHYRAAARHAAAVLPREWPDR